MTGEGGALSEGTPSRKSDRKKDKKKPPKAPESEASVLSGMETKPSTAEGGERPGTGNEVGNEADIPEEDENGNQMVKKPTKPLAPVDRNKFGKLISNYGVGGSFGELALVNQDNFRNASIIADEDTDMIVIDRELFERSLKEEQEARYAEIREFIDIHPFFKDMNTRFKKLLEMSIRKERYIFDTNIIRQGDPVTGLHFIISGSANISIQPKKHVNQFPHLWPFEAGVDQIAIEFEHLREARRAAILRKYEDPSVWETKPEELVIRREQGYAAIEKKMKENHINLCSVQNKEVLGDLEMLCNLGTYVQTVRCTSDTHCFVLDNKNFERLIGKKNNVQTMDIMREYLKSKLYTRMQMRNANLIPLLGYLHQQLTEQSLPPRKRVEPFKTSKSLPDVEEEMQHLLQYFRDGKEVVLIKPCVPGVVYYHELMQEKAKQRAAQRKASKGGGEIKLGSVYKSRQKRQPRSMLQIRESLKHMMEAEVIEMEAKKHRKKRPKSRKRSKSYKAEKAAREKSIPKSPRTLIEMSKSPSDQVSVAESEAFSKNGDYVETNGKNNLDSVQNLPKSTPPVFVTEVAKDSELKLPAIREENTQDDLLHNAAVNANNANSETVNNNKQGVKDTGNGTAQATDRSSKMSKHSEPMSDRSTVSTQRKTPKNTSSSKEKILPPIENNGSNTSVPDIGTNGLSPVPKLPMLDGNQVLGSSQDPAATTRSEDLFMMASGRDSAMRFVNQRVQDRMTSSAMGGEDESHTDPKNSEPFLSLLEHKIQAFHIKYGKGDKTKNLPPLKRYKLDADERPFSERPKPGGKVRVTKQLCKFNDCKYAVKDHQHIRYRMVPSLSEYDRVQKSRLLLQQSL